VNLWRRKVITTLRDGYAAKHTSSEDHLVTIEDLRVEQNAQGEGRTIVTMKVVR